MVINGTIWCSSPDNLNDDEEFKFDLDYKPSPDTANLLAKVIEKYIPINSLPPQVSANTVLQNGNLESISKPIIDSLIKECREEIGITSFSLIKSDDHLWSEYGAKGNGVCIEIEIPDSLIGQSFHPVNYVPKKSFHIDSFLESALFKEKAPETYRNILLTKTRSWAKEKEIRFIGKKQNVNWVIDGHIKEVTFGPNVPEIEFEILTDEIAEICSLKNIKISRL